MKNDEVTKIEIVKEFDDKDLEVLGYATSGLRVLGSLPLYNYEGKFNENQIPNDMNGVEEGLIRKFYNKHKTLGLLVPTTVTALFLGAGCLGGADISKKEKRLSKADAYRIYAQSLDPTFQFQKTDQELQEFKDDYFNLPTFLDMLGSQIPGKDSYEWSSLSAREAIAIFTAVKGGFQYGDYGGIECNDEMVHLEKLEPLHPYEAFYKFAEMEEIGYKPSKKVLEETIESLECNKDLLDEDSTWERFLIRDIESAIKFVEGEIEYYDHEFDFGKELEQEDEKENELKEDSVSHKTIGSSIKFLTEELKNYDIERRKQTEPPRQIKWEEIEKLYDSIEYLSEIDGKLAYNAKKDGKYFIVYDGEEIGKQYENARYPADVDGKLAYQGKKDGKWLVVYDDREIITRYEHAFNPADVDGKLAYMVLKGPNKFIVYDGKEIGTQYAYAGMPVDIDGKLAYLAVIYPYDIKEFVVYDGKEIGTQYDNAWYPVDIDGKLAYQAIKDDKYFIVYDGEEIGKQYDKVGYTTDVGGKLAYWAEKDGKWFVVYDGREIGSYDLFTSIVDIDGELVYAGVKGKEYFVVYNGQEIGPYDEIQDMEDINGKLVFVTQKDFGNPRIFMEK